MDNRPMVTFEGRSPPRPGTKFNFGTALQGSKQPPSYTPQRLGEVAALRVGAQLKQIARRPLSLEERQWLDKPIARKYLQGHE